MSETQETVKERLYWIEYQDQNLDWHKEEEFETRSYEVAKLHLLRVLEHQKERKKAIQRMQATSGVVKLRLCSVPVTVHEVHEV